MRALLIDADVRAAIARVVAYAERHVMSFDELQRMAAGTLPPPGNHPACRYIPDGYRAVYSLEEQPTAGRCRHLSVSVDGAGGRLPSPAALAEIGRLFGFDEAHMTALARQRMPEGGRLALWIERESDPPSVNIVEPV